MVEIIRDKRNFLAVRGDAPPEIGREFAVPPGRLVNMNTGKPVRANPDTLVVIAYEPYTRKNGSPGHLITWRRKSDGKIARSGLNGGFSKWTAEEI